MITRASAIIGVPSANTPQRLRCRRFSSAQRVIVVDRGRIIADDTPARLKAEHVGDRIVLGFDAETDAAAAASRLAALRPGRTGTRLFVTAQGAPRRVPGILDELRAAGLPAAEVEVIRPTLDDVFLKLTGRSLREGGAVPDNAGTTELVEV